MHEILSGQIWVCRLAWFLVNHGFMLWLRKFYGRYWTYRGVVSWQLDVYGQPVCILQMGSMPLECAVNNICYTWLCGFNFQVRVNVLSYNLICSSIGMLGSYMNFMNWFLYDLGAECIWWLYYVFWGTLCDGHRIFLVLRYRFWDEYVSLW